MSAYQEMPAMGAGALLALAGASLMLITSGTAALWRSTAERAAKKSSDPRIEEESQ